MTSSNGSPGLDQLLRQLDDLIRDAVPDGEIVTHFDVLVQTRPEQDTHRIRFRRFSTPGSDPIMSLGLLHASTARLSRQLGLAE